MPEIVPSRSKAGTVLPGEIIAGQSMATECLMITPRNESPSAVMPKSPRRHGRPALVYPTPNKKASRISAVFLPGPTRPNDYCPQR